MQIPEANVYPGEYMQRLRRAGGGGGALDPQLYENSCFEMLFIFL